MIKGNKMPQRLCKITQMCPFLRVAPRWKMKLTFPTRSPTYCSDNLECDLWHPAFLCSWRQPPKKVTPCHCWLCSCCNLWPPPLGDWEARLDSLQRFVFGKYQTLKWTGLPRESRTWCWISVVLYCCFLFLIVCTHSNWDVIALKQSAKCVYSHWAFFVELWVANSWLSSPILYTTISDIWPDRRLVLLFHL